MKQAQGQGQISLNKLAPRQGELDIRGREGCGIMHGLATTCVNSDLTCPETRTAAAARAAAVKHARSRPHGSVCRSSVQRMALLAGCTSRDDRVLWGWLPSPYDLSYHRRPVRMGATLRTSCYSVRMGREGRSGADTAVKAMDQYCRQLCCGAGHACLWP